MTNGISTRGTPEEQELDAKRRELAALEGRVSERELELVTARVKLHHFESAYLTEVGVFLTELDEISAQIAERLAERTPADEVVQTEAKTARQRAGESSRATEGLDEEPALDKGFEPSEELRNLYRKASMQFHPDLTTDENERIKRTNIMSEINRLYEEGKEDELRELVENYSKRPEAVRGEGIAFDLIRVIRQIAQLRQRLDAIKSELDALQEGHMFELYIQVEDAKEKGIDLLKNLQASLKVEIQEAQERLATLDETP